MFGGLTLKSKQLLHFSSYPSTFVHDQNKVVPSLGVLFSNPTKQHDIPVMVDEDLKQKKDICHIEMYHHRSHYEAIVSMESDQFCEVPPQLTGKDDPKRMDL